MILQSTYNTPRCSLAILWPFFSVSLIGLSCWDTNAVGEGIPPIPQNVIQVDSFSDSGKTRIRRAEALLADEQWADGITALESIQKEFGHQLIEIPTASSFTTARFISVREFCHRRLATLPKEGLFAYRNRVDHFAQPMFEDAVKTRNRQKLELLLDRYYCSSWGDNALWALGEILLEQGDFHTARRYFQQLHPKARLSPRPISRDAKNTMGMDHELFFPDCEFPLPDIQFRLVLTTILEESTLSTGNLRENKLSSRSSRGRRELETFEELHPLAQGVVAGRKVSLAATLRKIFQESRPLPPTSQAVGWSTFAGNPERNRQWTEPVDFGSDGWETNLREVPPPNPIDTVNAGLSAARVAEDATSLLGYHPIWSPVDGRQLVFVCNNEQVFAFDMQTGLAAWPGSPRHGEIYHLPVRTSRQFPSRGLGAVRFTLNVTGNRLYARLGSSVTSGPTTRSGFREPSQIVCLDLQRQGALLWKLPDEHDYGDFQAGLWAYEGTPVSDGESVYFALKRNDVNPRVFVACHDAKTGRQRWRRFVCSGESFGLGRVDEMSHVLLTLKEETIYIATHLGAVAALRKADGAFRWLTTYQRRGPGNITGSASYVYRDLAPAMFHEGLLLVAPSDQPAILALDADTGQLLWRTTEDAGDAIHLLGVSGNHLVASGHRLYGISLSRQGAIDWVWPRGAEKVGKGRGMLAGNVVYFPTRDDRIIMVDAVTGLQSESPIDLRLRKSRSGNLAPAPGFVLIAAADRLFVLSQWSSVNSTDKESSAEDKAGVN